ncbi:MAG: hypothetical protein IJK44_05080 [Bacteroidales bacterium]|nr:hypothetical protein [Bacteroidales bacterium]
MKKYFIIAVAAIAAMAACSKNEVEFNATSDSNRIGFEVANYSAQTKANVALTNAEDGLYQFHTYAYQFPKLGDAVEFMNDDVFAWDNAATPAKVTTGTGIYKWATENDYFWPKTGYINFYSYAGTQAPAETVSTDKKTVTLTYQNKTIVATDNILVADAALHFNGNQETYKVDGTEGSAHVTKGVPTLFRHMLAKLYMDVKIQIPEEKKSANTIWKVEVLDNFDIDGNSTVADGEKSQIYPVNKGTLTLENADALAANAALNTTEQQWTRTQTGNDVVSGWKPGDTNELVQLHQESVLTLPVNTITTDPVQLLAWRTVMPQLTENVAFKLIYKVQALHGSTVFMEEIRTVGFDAAADLHDLMKGASTNYSIDKWESNKKITYHIIIDPVTEKVTFDPAVEDYDKVEANANNVINIDPDGLVEP